MTTDTDITITTTDFENNEEQLHREVMDFLENKQRPSPRHQAFMKWVIERTVKELEKKND